MNSYSILNGGIILGYLFNINGRICFYFATIWGFLGVGLIKYINPWISHILENSINLPVKLAIFFLTIFLFIDILISIFALRVFFKKVASDCEINRPITFSKLETKFLAFFDEDIMLKTYPNLQIAGTDMNNVYVDSIYKNIQTYYLKLKE